MKIPYPTIDSKLAVVSHMYICKETDHGIYKYIKCQTLKPKMLTSHLMKHFVDENADISRNPFQRTTRIDCDKLFVTDSVHYDDMLRTPSRPDICEELYNTVLVELEADGYDTIKMNEDDLININPLITKI